MALILPESRFFDWAGDGQRIVCPCCGMAHPHTERFRHHIELLQELRSRKKRGITITSGFRCPKYNRSINGADKSQHILRRKFSDDTFATDQVLSPSTTRRGAKKGRIYETWFEESLELAHLAKDLGFNGIGVYRGDPDREINPSTHFDLRQGDFAVWGSPEAIEQLGD